MENKEIKSKVANTAKNIAIKVATHYAKVACPFFTYQPKMSNEVKNLRKEECTMKKSKIITAALTICLFSISMCACSDKEQKKVDETASLNTCGEYRIENVSDVVEDGQNYWTGATHQIARGEGGYYYGSDDDQYLLFYDEGLKESYPVCAKADCSHDTVRCNAYIGKGIRSDIPAESYLISTVYYYRGNIYLLNTQGDLVRLEPDGSGREKIANVYTYDGRTGVSLMFHENDVYVYDNYGHIGMSEEMTEAITRYSLDGKEKHVVAEYRGTGAYIENVRLYGNQMFFTISERNKKEINGQEQLTDECRGIYVYNIETNRYGKAIDRDVCGYAVVPGDNALFYFENGKGIYRYDIDSGETSLIMEADEKSQRLAMSYDGKYLYTSNSIWAAESRIRGKQIPEEYLVMKTDGTIVNRLEMDENVISLLFGDEKNLFITVRKRSDGSFGIPLMMLDKSDIENAEGGWIMLPDK